MGAEAYFYFTKYRSDLGEALRTLQREEFEAGRYDPGYHEATGEFLYKCFIPGSDSVPAPGPRHGSIDEAREAAMEDGTRSILDLFDVSDDPAVDHSNPYTVYGIAKPFPEETLLLLFQTTEPTKNNVTECLFPASGDVTSTVVEHFWNAIDRGTGRYIVTYEDDVPSEIFFAGFSYD